MLQLVLESGLMAVLDVYCASWLVIRLFHLTSFVWMFLEGESKSWKRRSEVFTVPGEKAPI